MRIPGNVEGLPKVRADMSESDDVWSHRRVRMFLAVMIGFVIVGAIIAFVLEN